MGSLSREQVKGMANKRQDSLEGGDCSVRASWEIEDQGLPERTAYSPAKSGIGRFGETDRAHTFGDAFEKAITDGAGSFGGYVARRKTGPSGGEDET
jgi:hypothetical protein